MVWAGLASGIKEGKGVGVNCGLWVGVQVSLACSTRGVGATVTVQRDGKVSPLHHTRSSNSFKHLFLLWETITLLPDAQLLSPLPVCA